MENYKINNRTIPVITDMTDKGERTYDIYSRLLKDRIIFLHGSIDEYSASITCAQLLALQSDNSKKPVQLYINSPGGVVYDALSIIDTMACMSYQVHTYIMGFAASAGSLVAIMGNKGNRNILKHSRTMIHQPSGGSRGQITDMEIQVQEGRKIKNLLIEMYAERTGQTIEFMKNAMERDNYLSAEEAKEMGLVDNILSGSWDKPNLF